MGHAPRIKPSGIRRFLESQSSDGLVLIGASVLALVLAISPVGPSYDTILHAYVGPLSIGHWINDALMAVFFLLVGLEIKREMLDGQLSTWPRRVLPGIAAAGGMMVPALVYIALNRGPTAAGWAIPAATDIAFALGVIALSAAPDRLRAQQAAPARVPVDIQPFFDAHCVRCHGERRQKGDVSLHQLAGGPRTGQQLELWERVLKVLERGEMPPRDEDQPDEDQRKKVARWIAQGLDAAPIDDAAAPAPAAAGAAPAIVSGAVPSIGFVSLGCPKATVDSEQILTQLRAEGYELAPDFESADLVIVNTCGFIDAAVEDMSVVIRGFARRRLRETVSPPDWIELAVEDTAVVMSGPDRRRLKIETDRKPRGIKGGGEDIEVSAWWEGHVLVRRFQGRGRREDRLSCAGEGDDIRLTMRTTISASRMPTPVRFRLRFRPDEGR